MTTNNELKEMFDQLVKMYKDADKSSKFYLAADWTENANHSMWCRTSGKCEALAQAIGYCGSMLGYDCEYMKSVMGLSV